MAILDRIQNEPQHRGENSENSTATRNLTSYYIKDNPLYPDGSTKSLYEARRIINRIHEYSDQYMQYFYISYAVFLMIFMLYFITGRICTVICDNNKSGNSTTEDNFTLISDNMTAVNETIQMRPNLSYCDSQISQYLAVFTMYLMLVVLSFIAMMIGLFSFLLLFCRRKTLPLEMHKRAPTSHIISIIWSTIRFIAFACQYQSVRFDFTGECPRVSMLINEYSTPCGGRICIISL